MSEQIEISSAKLAYFYLKSRMALDVEEFWALALNSKKVLLRSKMIFRGTVDSCLIHPRDVFRFAVLENASSLIIAHNHPSCDDSPSHQDLVLTKRLIQASQLMQIPIVDHIILTTQSYRSLASDGLLRPSSRGRISRLTPLHL